MRRSQSEEGPGRSSVLALIDRQYLVVMAILSVLVLYLNYHGWIFEAIMPNYWDFKSIVLAGFDPGAASLFHTPTFPMWGYGWLLILVDNKPGLLLLQFVLALFAAWFFIRFLEGTSLSRGTILCFKICLTLSLPWYALHSRTWPYSPGASLFLISFALLVQGLSEPGESRRKIAFSGVVFGLVLNLRSEWLLLPLLYVVTAVLCLGFNRAVLGKMALWMGILYLGLVPWALYTRHVTGRLLFTSTNGGAAAFEGLGDLPGNAWGITPSDGDPVMMAVLRRRFGWAISPEIYEADVFLKGEVVRMARERPAEYARKCLHSLRAAATGGVYPGEFCRISEENTDTTAAVARLREQVHHLRFDRVKDASELRLLFSFFVLLLSNSWGRVVVLLAYLALPVAITVAYRDKNLLLGFAAANLLCQMALNVLIAHQQPHMSSMYPFYVLNMSAGLAWLRGRFQQARTSPSQSPVGGNPFPDQACDKL